MRIYDCRHAAATTWLRAGMPLGEVANVRADPSVVVTLKRRSISMTAVELVGRDHAETWPSLATSRQVRAAGGSPDPLAASSPWRARGHHRCMLICMQSTSVRIDSVTHDELKRLAAELHTTVGNTVTLAVRALRQDRIGDDLRAPLREDEAAWLDADLG